MKLPDVVHITEGRELPAGWLRPIYAADLAEAVTGWEMMEQREAPPEVYLLAHFPHTYWFPHSPAPSVDTLAVNAAFEKADTLVW